MVVPNRLSIDNLRVDLYVRNARITVPNAITPLHASLVNHRTNYIIFTKTRLVSQDVKLLMVITI